MGVKNMKTYLYLSTAIISVSLAASGNAWAQCVSTQDCTALGYTETSCPNGNGVKCPFGNKWFCASTEITPEQCTELGFTQPCTGTNQTGGAGQACNGKYAVCTCASGYKWNNGNCEQDTSLNGEVGDLYYCNGVVVGVKAADMDFYVALKDVGVMEFPYAKSACNGYSFCKYAGGILPSTSQLSQIYKNKSYINNLLQKYGGKPIGSVTYWASDYAGRDGCAYLFDMSRGTKSPTCNAYVGAFGYTENARAVLY